MSLFSKHITLQNSGVFASFTDWHSHILPGVDDGVRSMDDALKILNHYEALGVQSVWLTPHIMEDFPNTPSDLRLRFQELQSAYSGPITLHLAAENMLDNLFEERLAARDFLPLGEQGDHLLVETSYFSPPMDLFDILQRIKSAGYYPVLAHPERYVYMGDSHYQHLQAQGIKLQLNLFSLVGLYGREAQKKSQWLLKKGFYTLFASDLHSHHALTKVLTAKVTPSQLKSLPNNTLE